MKQKKKRAGTALKTGRRAAPMAGWAGWANFGCGSSAAAPPACSLPPSPPSAFLCSPSHVTPPPHFPSMCSPTFCVHFWDKEFCWFFVPMVCLPSYNNNYCDILSSSPHPFHLPCLFTLPCVVSGIPVKKKRKTNMHGAGYFEMNRHCAFTLCTAAWTIF